MAYIILVAVVMQAMVMLSAGGFIVGKVSEGEEDKQDKTDFLPDFRTECLSVLALSPLCRWVKNH